MFRYLFCFNVIRNNGGLAFINVYKNLPGPIEQAANPRELILEVEDNVRSNLNCGEIWENGETIKEELTKDHPDYANLVLVKNIIYLGYEPPKKENA